MVHDYRRSKGFLCMGGVAMNTGFCYWGFTFWVCEYCGCLPHECAHGTSEWVRPWWGLPYQAVVWR